ncbi:MAG: ribosome recycling factor [Bacteroidetes bacterium]|nr:ribosome recycling factor [Bacteroidota bacterium]HNR19732.1 ribosome recycling factor [Bacteroidia bacterium]HNU31970.1 ribosome recycling factor [Bacteroidia bacterium]
MSEFIKKTIDGMQSHLDKAIDHLEHELTKVRTGRANPQMLDEIKIDYYGAPTPLNQVASVNTPDARTIVIQPWEKSMLQAIEKAIQAANLGFNPQNDGSIVRISVPPLTEERRKELVKKAKAEGEHCKVTIRNSRRDANEALKKELKKAITEDELKTGEQKIQQIIDAFIVKVDKHLETKEKEIMTV